MKINTISSKITEGVFWNFGLSNLEKLFLHYMSVTYMNMILQSSAPIICDLLSCPLVFNSHNQASG